VRADVVLSSLGGDTAARIELNRLCLEAGVPHLCAQSDADAAAAAINLVVPGKTACLCCLAAMVEAAAASATKRPSSMPIAPGARSAPAPEPEPGDPAERAYSPGLPLMLAGLLAQNAVKLHLGLGSVLAGFRHKYGADTVAIPGALAPPAPEAALMLQPSKEFRSFNTEPLQACQEPACRRQHKRQQQEQQDARDSAAAVASVQQQHHRHTYSHSPPVI
jgi:hypothetical protein